MNQIEEKRKELEDDIKSVNISRIKHLERGEISVTIERRLQHL